MSGLSSTLSSLAKRSIPITSGFNDLVRAIGKAKSKDEEDGIVAKMVDLCRGALAGGRRDPRTSKELLLYLVYIDMLGHDTRWAHAWVIQLCSDKSLIVKKVGGSKGGKAVKRQREGECGRRAKCSQLSLLKSKIAKNRTLHIPASILTRFLLTTFL